ncbi:MAG: mevalonate kinase [Pseudomonadota bacterium]
MTITASAPGSVMVTGEHAVVYGHPCVVAAVEQRATVTVAPLPGRTVRVHSALGEVETTLDALEPAGPLRFVLACVAAIGPEQGVEITTTSAIDPTLGLGSSAAVTVATFGALAAFSGAEVDIHAEALVIVRAIQGRGSGADLAASLHGGLSRYQLGAAVEALPVPPAMSLKYVGYKTPTGEVLARVAEAWAGRDVDALYTRMGAAAEAAVVAARARDWAAMAVALDGYQGLMAELGVSNADLDALVDEGRGQALAAKISGSGLGDCVLAFGGVPHGWERAKLAREGLVIHG